MFSEKKNIKRQGLFKKYQDCCYANKSKVCKVKPAWHRLTLNSVLHAYWVVTFLLTSIVYISAWKESWAILLYHRSSISDYDLCSSFWLNIHQVWQSPYSPDLTPYDIFLFPKIKSHLKKNKISRHEGNQRE